MLLQREQRLAARARMLLPGCRRQLGEACKVLPLPKPAHSTRHPIHAQGRETSRDTGASAVTPPKAASQQAGTG